MAARDEHVGHMGADETGAAGHEDARHLKERLLELFSGALRCRAPKHWLERDSPKICWNQFPWLQMMIRNTMIASSTSSMIFHTLFG
jgi:hypothetical protein